MRWWLEGHGQAPAAAVTDALMRRFGGWRDLCAAPAGLVEQILVVMEAESIHERLQQQMAEREARR